MTWLAGKKRQKLGRKGRSWEEEGRARKKRQKLGRRGRSREEEARAGGVKSAWRRRGRMGLMIGKCVYEYFNASQVRPEGWLREQLMVQARGLSGNLDLVWPDIRDSKWIGGSRDGWERMPYWLDGFIPLAWLLDDEEMKKRAAGYIDAILSRQQEDGWICPCTKEERREYDVWVLFLICKVLTVYHDCTGDERMEEVVYRALQSLYFHLESRTLFDWAQARWFECLIPLFWIYRRRPEDWMLDLARTLKIEGFDYTELFGQWAFQKPERRWNYKTHVVNIAMSLKAEALYSLLSGENSEKTALQAHELLLRDHGMAVGHFTGDECLAGNSPVQGSELCSVVEAMYSYEWLFSITGNPFWADQLELLAFNALPAALSPDMWTHQYDQMSNQPQCTIIPEEKVHFGSNNGEAHLFGLEPHFGCCTANFSQGFPKFALSVFSRSEDGIMIGAIAPAVLQTEVNGVRLSCRIRTEYPFEDIVMVEVECEEEVNFCLSIRIPLSADQAIVDGTACDEKIAKIRKRWKDTTVIPVKFIFSERFEERPNHLYSLKRGSLVFALPVEELWIKREYTRDGVERKEPYCDYELHPASEWAFAFSDQSAVMKREPFQGAPFSPEKAPVKMKVQLVPIQWQMEHGICSPVPSDTTPAGDLREVELIPYGCTNLRMTELPSLG